MKIKSCNIQASDGWYWKWLSKWRRKGEEIGITEAGELSQVELQVLNIKNCFFSFFTETKIICEDSENTLKEKFSWNVNFDPIIFVDDDDDDDDDDLTESREYSECLIYPSNTSPVGNYC